MNTISKTPKTKERHQKKIEFVDKKNRMCYAICGSKPRDKGMVFVVLLQCPEYGWNKRFLRIKKPAGVPGHPPGPPAGSMKTIFYKTIQPYRVDTVNCFLNRLKSRKPPTVIKTVGGFSLR